MSNSELPAVAVRNLSKSFISDSGPQVGPTITALSDVNFEIERGGALGIIGENGSGKSTLLKILTGVLIPSDGEVRLEGKVLSVLDIGSGFHPDLTGRENVLLTGRILGMKENEIQNRLQRIIDFSGIENFFDVAVKYYSSGMYLRLAFSLIVNLDADILVFDEVMSVGDNEFQIKSLDLIKRLQSEGKTIIFASHSLESMAKICNRCILLDKGRLRAIGKTSDVILEYMSGSVQKYLDGQNSDSIWEELSTTEERTSMEDWDLEGKPKRPIGKTEVSWKESKSPGDENVRLVSLQILGNACADIFKSEDNLTIEVRYKKLTTLPTMLCFMFSYNLTTPVFIANPFLSQDSPYKMETDIGDYKLTCRLPAFLLNNGVFSIDVFVLAEYDKELFRLRNGLIFNLHYDDSYLSRLNYDGKFPGGLMPVLKWGIERVS